MIDERAVEIWNDELEELFLRTGHRFRCVEPRRRMRDYIRGLLGPVGHKNRRQLAEYAGHRTPDRLQRLPNGARWDADGLRDDLQPYVAERLGEPTALDDNGFLKKGTTSAGVQRQYSGTAGRTENRQISVFAAGNALPSVSDGAASVTTVRSGRAARARPAACGDPRRGQQLRQVLAEADGDDLDFACPWARPQPQGQRGAYLGDVDSAAGRPTALCPRPATFAATPPGCGLLQTQHARNATCEALTVPRPGHHRPAPSPVAPLLGDDHGICGGRALLHRTGRGRAPPRAVRPVRRAGGHGPQTDTYLLAEATPTRAAAYTPGAMARGGNRAGTAVATIMTSVPGVGYSSLIDGRAAGPSGASRASSRRSRAP